MPKKRKEVKQEPLNLVPIMNLVTILIPVLLVAIKSVELSVIDTTLPAINTTPNTQTEVDENPPLNLSLGVTNKGLRIIGADNYIHPQGPPPAGEGGVRPPDIMCKSRSVCQGVDDYNWSDLKEKLTMIKKSAQKDDRDSDNVILVPEGSIRYEVLIRAMDVSRENKDDPVNVDGKSKPRKLFPNVVIAGGAK